MYEIIIRGGLGNQLFCLLFAYKIFLKYNTIVYLNLTNYKTQIRNDRPFLLQRLFAEIPGDVFKFSDSKLSYFLFFFTRLIDKLFIKNLSNRLPGDKQFCLKYWPNRKLYSGYFQKFCESDLDNQALNLLRKNIYPHLEYSGSNYLAIHIRRGDYLLKEHIIHGVIEERYLLKESQYFISKYNFEGITVFSDSPELIDLSNFDVLNTRIHIDEGGDPIKVFKRMASHKGLVASNSSFSLWAGLIGNIKYFSIPYYWMKGIKSSVIGFKKIRRYDCII